VLKKSASVSTAEKYAPEIEICVFGRRFRTRISRSSVQKRCVHPSMFERFGKTDFFNRIDRSLPVVKGWSRPNAAGQNRERSAKSSHPDVSMNLRAIQSLMLERG